jgi:hypothetical protein
LRDAGSRAVTETVCQAQQDRFTEQCATHGVSPPPFGKALAVLPVFALPCIILSRPVIAGYQVYWVFRAPSSVEWFATYKLAAGIRRHPELMHERMRFQLVKASRRQPVKYLR